MQGKYSVWRDMVLPDAFSLWVDAACISMIWFLRNPPLKMSLD